MRMYPSINTIMVPSRDSTHFSSRARNAPTPAKSTLVLSTPLTSDADFYLMRKSSHPICHPCYPPFWKIIINPLIPYLSLKVNEENEVDNNLQNHSDLLIQLTQNHTFLVLKSTAQNNWTRKTTYCNLKLAISFTHLINSSTNKKLKTFFFFEKNVLIWLDLNFIGILTKSERSVPRYQVENLTIWLFSLFRCSDRANESE